MFKLFSRYYISGIILTTIIYALFGVFDYKHVMNNIAMYLLYYIVSLVLYTIMNAVLVILINFMNKKEE